MRRQLSVLCLAVICAIAAGHPAFAADKADDAVVTAVRQRNAQLMAAFNAGKVDDLVAMFLPKGELIDEEGTVYQGTQEIKNLLTAFYKQFPGARLTMSAESIRIIEPVAIDEGSRTMTTADGAVKSQFRYIAIWTKGEKDWQLASLRDLPDEPVPTAQESLQPLAWLAGEWINEGADGKVSITYRWSEDKNFLLGDFVVTPADGPARHKSKQRIGWDPSIGKIRSWLFDSDGGFGEATWTLSDEGVVIKTSSVNPDGATATATMTIKIKDKDHYSIRRADRVVGDSLEDDFEITVARRPPAAGK